MFTHTNLTPSQLHVLQHSLGLDQYGRGNPYRNNYCAPAKHAGTTVWKDLEVLIVAGYMHDHGPQAMYGGGHHLSVTDRGEAAVALQSPAPPKVSRSARRYAAFNRSDCGWTFLEWLIVQQRRKEAGEIASY